MSHNPENKDCSCNRADGSQCEQPCFGCTCPPAVDRVGEIRKKQNEGVKILPLPMSQQEEWESINNKLDDIDFLLSELDKANAEIEDLKTIGLHLDCENTKLRAELEAARRDTLDNLPELLDERDTFRRYANDESAKNHDLQAELDKARAELEAVKEKYSELLYQVDVKVPEESRHETTKRWLVERRTKGTGTGMDAQTALQEIRDE